ncbi:MAG: PASTA domain-containing protein [Salinibacter sp.]
MRVLQAAKAALNWFRILFKNPYFWGGLGALLLIGIGTYVLVDAVIMPSYTRHGVSVQVPDVENRPYQEAKRLIEKRGLTVKRQVGRYNPNVPREAVVDQNPLPNSNVKPGRRVYLTVNAGEVPMVSVPDLNGISVRDAKNRVSSLGLKTGMIKPDSIPSPYPNTITRQSPEPGDSLKKGGVVNLWYSTGLGQDTVRVPSVVGRTVQEARSLLLQQKLRAVVVDSRMSEASQTSGSAQAPTQPDTSLARQFVQRQGRAPKTKVRAGTEIRLFTTANSTQAPDPQTALQDTTATGH